MDILSTEELISSAGILDIKGSVKVIVNKKYWLAILCGEICMLAERLS